MDKNLKNFFQKKEIKEIEKEINKILKENETINFYYSQNFELKDELQLITKNDLKLFYFIFLFIFKTSKYKDIQIFFRMKNKKIICNENTIDKHKNNNLQILIQKFINICLFNHNNLSLYFGIQSSLFIIKILKLTKIFFLNDYIEENNLKEILILQIILCLYKINEKNKDEDNKIKNINQLYLVIDYLRSFCRNNNYYFKEYKMNQFNNIVSSLLKIINKNIIYNYYNQLLLSRNKKFFNLIELSRITSIGVTSMIIKTLVTVYKYKLNIDYILDDLSDQFLYNIKNETINNKTNSLIAKNILLNEILEKEKMSFKEKSIFIKEGFYFNDFDNNGIICESFNKFPHENDGYSIVVSFNLIIDNNEIINKKKLLYTIFSLVNKDNNILMQIFIEDCVLKMRLKKEKNIFEIGEINSNTNNVLWLIQKREKKHKMIFFLNNKKNVLNSAYYPEGIYKVNLGFDLVEKNISKNNFVGIIGTFILFKKCFVKDENDFINITKLTELKANYEDIIYTKVNKELYFLDKNLNLILNKLSNNIDINKDIEIIISTKSLGLLDYNNLNELKSEFNFFFFHNECMEKQKQPKFYFRNKNHMENNLVFPIQLNNTYIEFINNHGFFYLQLELYYFINILSFQIKENKENKNNLIQLKEQQDVYLNVSRICSLFFFCLDSFNSNILINKSQKDLIQKEIDNFKYTLNDLISIYSKYNFKIKTYFLSLFVEKISEKKYFEYCLFIFTFDYYEINDNEAFDVLFNYLNHISIDDCDNSQIKELFTRLLDFDKIYLSKEIQKNTKKEYSKLMKYLIKKSLDQQIEDCFFQYRTKLKTLKKELTNNNIIIDIQEEELNNENDNRHSSDDYNENTRKISRTSSNTKNGNKEEYNNKNIEILKLLYKYLKNLYIGVNDLKTKFVELCGDRKNIISTYFNELFNILCQIYPIEKDGKYNENLSLENQNEEITLSELIKSLCIRFLDDLFYEDNMKLLDEESKKQKNGDAIQDDYENKKGSSGNVKTSFNSCKSRPNLKRSSLIRANSNESIKNGLNGSLQSSFISSNYVPVTIESILMSKMEFFEKIILSKYTFKSIFFMLIRDIPNEKKLKIIKDDKNMKKKFILKEKNFSKTRFTIGVIISLFEKLHSNGYDTLFNTKIEIIEYCYNFFIDNLILNTLNNYFECATIKRKNIKPMINSIFVNKGNIYNINRLYNIMIDIIFNSNLSLYVKNRLNYKEHLGNLLIKIQNDITEIINKSLFDLVDLFYFKFLREIYVENEKNDKFVFQTIILIINKLVKKIIENEINRVIEINCKNLLILLYEIIFFINKRTVLLHPENELFIKNIILFLSKFMDNCNIFYIKILFPIEEINPKVSKRKLLIEIIFEIILEIHLDYIRNPNLKYLQISEFLLKELFDEKTIQSNLMKNQEKKNFKNLYTPFYIMDKLSYFSYNNNPNNLLKISENLIISKKFYELKDYLLSKYKDEYEEQKNLFSVSIIFSIKILIAIKVLIYNPKRKLSSENQNNKDNAIIEFNEILSKDTFIQELKSQFLNLCKNIIKIHEDHTSSNPFKSIGVHSNFLYENFRSFIVDKLSFVERDQITKIIELMTILNDNQRFLKIYERVIYTQEGRAKLYNEKTFNQIMSTNKSEAILAKDNESQSSALDNKSKYSSNEDKNSMNFNNSLKGSFISINTFKPKFNIDYSSKSQSQIFKKNKNNLMLIYNENNEIANEKNIYKIKIKFEKIIKNYFSFYFKKLLSYDEDFINIKKIYEITYNKEIKNINEYGINYPVKFKNYITNNYMRTFLKKDFDFFTDGYFKISHNYLYNEKYKYNYEIQNQLLFPLKSLFEENNDIGKKNSDNIEESIIAYECEILTARGSIFGNISTFDNCLLFKSDLKNDKRKKKPNTPDKNENNLDNQMEKINYLNYACCSIEYDHLNRNKKIIIEYNNIREVVNRTFFYSWTSLEIFMKDGKSYLFNFFNEDTNNDISNFLKSQKVTVIRKVADYLKKEEMSKKWKEGKISTFDYLLLLNKLSSRTYNDPNQYPIMPWLFLKDGVEFKRNFDIPMAVQDEDKQEEFLMHNNNYTLDENSPTHSNHYSTSAYIYFYLMRTNPFTNDMIKFQSKNFDVPDRQYANIKQTLFLCQRMNNNRELIPEFFSLPEININLNVNDFGKQRDGLRVHNISFEPYANNAIEFAYLLKNLINNDPEINNNINQWIDFIFGINQTGNYISNKSKSYNIQNKKKFKILRKFNSYCYGQNYSIRKFIIEAKKLNKTESNILSDIKTTLAISISFGQCPYQLLSEPHPSKYISINKSEEKTNLINNKEDKDNNKMEESNITPKPNSNPSFYNFREIYELKPNNEISYFTKSSNYNYLNCLSNDIKVEIYKLIINNKQKKEYLVQKPISPKAYFILPKKTKNNIFISKIKYLFCELSENSFIFCKTMDKTLIYINQEKDTSFLLKSYTTCIIKINTNEFITGHDNGRICKWKINFTYEENKEYKPELELILIVKSNKSNINCLVFNEKLNIILSCDNISLIMRKNFDFEYMNSIDIKDEEKLTKKIIDVKISDYELIYICIYIEEKNEQELQGYTLNGIYFGKYVGTFNNFEINKRGQIIIGEIDKPIISVLDPINFNEIHNIKILPNNININNFCCFHFHFEEPNFLYYGIKDETNCRIKIYYLEESEKIYFF